MPMRCTDLYSVSVRYRDNIKKEMVSYARRVEQIVLIKRRGVEVSIRGNSHTNIDILRFS